MKTIKIEMEVALPETQSTEQEIKDWLYYEMGYSGSISSLNPIIKEGECVDVKYMSISDFKLD